MLFSIQNTSNGFVRTRTPEGTKVFWSSGNISVRVNNSNSSGISGSSINSIILNSTSEWEDNSGYDFSLFSTSESGTTGNDIYFSTNSSYFGSFPSLSSVLGLTIVSYSVSNGRIVEADILINDGKSYNDDDPASMDTLTGGTNPDSSNYYFGDVLTHELGHFVGLAHSLNKDSSMIFVVFRGQHSVAEDDISGAHTLKSNNTRSGSISGTVVGGSSDDYVGIFGAHVQAISSSLGVVSSSTLSDTDGTFTISGLPLDDTYYIYVSPSDAVPSSSLPSYYSTAESAYCSGGSSYRGGFYQGCSSASSGHPTGVALSASSASRAIGNVTIRCSLDTASSGNLTDAVQDIDSEVGEAIVGDASGAASYSIDLNGITPGSNKLNIKILSNHLQFQSRFELEIDDGSVSAPFSPTYVDFDEDSSTDAGISIDSDKNPNLDVEYSIDLANLDTTSVIDINVNPLNSVSTGIGISNFSDWLFPVSALKDSSESYLMIISLTDSSGNTIYPRTYSLSDNSSCVDGPLAESVSANLSSSGGTTTTTTSQEGGMGCGTVDFGNHNGGGGPKGPLAIAICLLSGLGVLLLRRRKFALKRH